MRTLLTQATLPILLLNSIWAQPAANGGNDYFHYDESGNLAAKVVSGQLVSWEFDGNNRLIGGQSDAPVIASHGPIAKKVTWKDEGRQNADILLDHKGFAVAKRVGEKVELWQWDGSEMCLFDGSVREQELEVVDYLGSTPVVGAGGAYGGSNTNGRFTGKFFDKDLNAFVFPYRFYQPDLARWLEADPIGYPEGTNNFAYVSGRPLTLTDPLGLAPYVEASGGTKTENQVGAPPHFAGQEAWDLKHVANSGNASSPDASLESRSLFWAWYPVPPASTHPTPVPAGSTIQDLHVSFFATLDFSLDASNDVTYTASPNSDYQDYEDRKWWHLGTKHGVPWALTDQWDEAETAGSVSLTVNPKQIDCTMVIAAWSDFGLTRHGPSFSGYGVHVGSGLGGSGPAAAGSASVTLNDTATFKEKL